MPKTKQTKQTGSAAAASKIQALQRGKSARRVAPVIGSKGTGFGGYVPPEEKVAAAKLQAIQRGKLARAKTRGMLTATPKP